MRLTKVIYLILFLLATRFNGSGQDVHFSQFFEAPLWRNPSLAGIFTGDIRVQAVYRDQWNSITKAYRTASVNAEVKMPVGNMSDFVTLGLQLLQDRAGTVALTTTHVLPAINYHKSLSSEKNRYLSLGFMGGWVQRRFDLSKITTNTQYNGGGIGENFAGSQYSYIDGSAGMSYNSTLGQNENNNFFIGAAYHHFTRPKNAFFRNAGIEIEPKWVFSGGMRFGVTDYAYITLQAFLHWNDALIPVVKLDYAPFSVAFSYDANISTLKPSSYGRGGFEISLSYFGFRKEKQDYLLCPRF